MRTGSGATVGKDIHSYYTDAVRARVEKTTPRYERDLAIILERAFEIAAEKYEITAYIDAATHTDAIAEFDMPESEYRRRRHGHVGVFDRRRVPRKKDPAASAD